MNSGTGRQSRDSDWEEMDAPKRHRMDLLLVEAKEKGVLVAYATMRCWKEGAMECALLGGGIG